MTTYLAIAAYLVIVPLYLRREWRDRHLPLFGRKESLVARIARYTEREV